MNSSLISRIKDINSFCRGTVLENQSLICLYKATIDGFKHTNFHYKMDYNPPLPTIAIMKTTSNAVGGVYNPLGWQSRDDYRDSIKTFLFIINSNGTYEKAEKLPGSPSVYDFSDRGLWFGDALNIPLNAKYSPLKRATSGTGTSFKPFPSGISSVFKDGIVDISEIECYVSAKMLNESKPMYERLVNDKSKEMNPFKAFELMLFGSEQS